VNPRDTPVALGFHVRSGFAIAAVVGGAADSPQVHALSRVELSDPGSPETRQPYHAGFGELESDARKLRRRLERVRAAAEASLAQFLAGCAPYLPAGAGLVVGSLGDPAAIANPHIRAHALEGQLFRSILQELLSDHGLPTALFLERSVYQEGATLLDRPEDQLRRQLSRLPHPGGPWRAAEKLATLAGWLVLARR